MLNLIINLLPPCFIYTLLDMLLKMNEILDCITIEGKLNAHEDALKKIVQYYVRDQNEERRKNNKEMRKQIMVEFGNLIHFFTIVY